MNMLKTNKRAFMCYK